jgi:hypothetical protein
VRKQPREGPQIPSLETNLLVIHMRHQEKVALLGRSNDKSMLSNTLYLFSNNGHERARERIILLTKKLVEQIIDVRL